MVTFMLCNIFEQNWYSESILEHFFLTVGQNNFGNKTPFLNCHQDVGKNEKGLILK